MNRLSILALVIPLAGCEAIKDTYEGLTNPLIAEGMILGVEAPESDEIDLESTGYSEGTGLTLFLADAESVTDIENAPVEGADVVLTGNTTVEATEIGGGGYAVTPSEDLVYEAGETWSVKATVGREEGTAHVRLPPAPNATIAEQHTQGEPVTLNLSGQGFTGALVVVVDVQTGDVTYSTQPEGIRDFYNLTRGDDEVGDITVPGTAFPGESVYALGVTGLTHTTSEDFDGMNTALSGVLAGKMRFFPVITATLPQE